MSKHDEDEINALEWEHRHCDTTWEVRTLTGSTFTVTGILRVDYPVIQVYQTDYVGRDKTTEDAHGYERKIEFVGHLDNIDFVTRHIPQEDA